MTSPRAFQQHFSASDYLAIERGTDQRSEFVDGAVVAMSGGSANHSRLKVDLLRLIANQLAGGSCEVFDSDLRVRVDAGRYTYPDLTIVCGRADFEDDQADVLLNPTVIFEVLSPSTEASDRGEKWSRYRRMPSLQQYMLISQDKVQVEWFSRQGEMWVYRDARGLEAVIDMEGIGCRIGLRDLYGRVAMAGGAEG